ncbi:MAG TPA: translocation/assembly module TamB domain-containing protein [Amaricoccus sp.]|nr:translocation/assembly module TamB domain-containing protein [Amaricoccus sp.]
MRRLLAALGVLVLVAIAALAQEDGGRNDNGFLINLLQNQLSTPSRQIRLSGVQGALSSRARIGQITISDPEGVWLQIDNAEIDWNRLALLRGRVDVNRLTAERVTWLRRANEPPPSRQLPTAEAQPFSLPELPVSVRLRALDFPSLRFEEPVFGQPAELKAAGALELAGGALDTTIDVTRLDGPGGQLALKAAFSNATRQLDLDLALEEPQGGVVATLLNIEGKPAIDLRLQGAGPLDDVDVNFSLDADRSRIAEGVVALRSGDEGLAFTVNFSGGLSPLVPAQFRDFFAGSSTVKVEGVKPAAGGLRIDTLDVAGAALRLTGGLETGPDSFLRSLTLFGTLGDPRGPALLLPVPGGQTRLHSAVLHVNFGDASRWDGLLVLDRLETAGIEMEDVTLRMGGLAKNLEDPATRKVTINVEGLATGLWSPKPEIASALGQRIDLFADATLNPGGPVELHQLQVSGNGLSIFSAGKLADLTFTGRNAIRVADLAVLSGLANRPLGGAVDLHADGSISPLSGGFDLTFDGTTSALALGDQRLDALLAGETTLSGRAVRDADGIRTEDLRIGNAQLSFASNGQISSKRTDIGFEAALSDLALLDPRASGRLTADGRATGDGRPIEVTLTAAVPEGELAGRRLTGAKLGFTGETDGANVTGALSGDGALDGLVMRLAADLAVIGEKRSLTGIDVAIGSNHLTGEVTQTGSAPLDGRLALDAPDIAPVATLALMEAEGAVKADVTLSASDPGQGVAFTASARDLVVGSNRIGSLDATATVADALGLPLIDGTLAAADLALAGFDVASLNATAEHTDGTSMRFSADARLAAGTLADLSGELARLPGGFSATLDTLRVRQQDATATLAAPATVTISGGTVELTPLALQVGSGSLTAEGKVAESFDIDVALSNLPLDIANAIRPDLGLGGTVNGTARVTGPRDAPDVRFDLQAAGIVSSITRTAGLPPIAVNASGTTADGRLNLRSSISATGLAATANGSIPLGQGDLALDLALQSFPLALADRAAGNLGLRGTISGSGRATGPLADPSVSFELRGEGLTADMLATNQVPPFALTASGAYRGGALELASARATAPGGLDIEGSGRIPLSGPGLDARVTGSLPLSLVNPLLASRAAEASGQVRISATARGSLAAPDLAGTVTLAGGTVFDPATNIRLQAMTLDAALAGNAVELHSFRAAAVGGGTIAAEGRVGLGTGFPADVNVRLNDVRYTDGVFVATRLSGDLSLAGPLVGGGGTLSGRIDIGRTEISVAEGLGANAQGALDQVSHIHTPPGVQATLDRAQVGTPRTAEASNRPGIGLDVRISAPNQIFVRGRGLDVEIGGEMRLRGTSTDMQPVGQFDLRRGRILILGQRIDFDEGSLTLVGNLDPQIHFVAETRSQDVTAIVTVAGRVSSPEITFSSEPPLPQDEVLAHVLFNRATADLSAFQLAQLAAAAAELAGGGGGPGIMSQIRGATGLDDLDIVTTDEGATAVRAGRYLSDNVYLDVQSDTRGDTQAELNLEVNRNITARASVGSDGNTTFGVFFERDY